MWERGGSAWFWEAVVRLSRAAAEAWNPVFAPYDQ